MKKLGYAPGFKNPTPYIRDMFDKLKLSKKINILDLATGNGRNARFLLDKGYDNIYCFDRIQDPPNSQVDYINYWQAGSPIIGLPKIDLFLIQYLFCFLNKTVKKKVVVQINKNANKNAIAIIEVQNTKSAGKINIDEIIPLFGKRWQVLNKRQKRCILKKM
jgi:hypothetical protein